MTTSSERPKRTPGAHDLVKVLLFFSSLNSESDIHFLKLKGCFGPNLSGIAMNEVLDAFKGNDKIEALYM